MLLLAVIESTRSERRFVSSNTTRNQPEATFCMQFTSIPNQSRVRTNNSNVNKNESFFSSLAIFLCSKACTHQPSVSPSSFRTAKREIILRKENDLQCSIPLSAVWMSFHLHRCLFFVLEIVMIRIVYLDMVEWHTHIAHTYFIRRNYSGLMMHDWDTFYIWNSTIGRHRVGRKCLGLILFGSTCAVYGGTQFVCTFASAALRRW